MTDIKHYNAANAFELFNPQEPITTQYVFEETKRDSSNHQLFLDNLDSLKVNLYYYGDHIKCRNALESFGNSFPNKEFIQINRNTKIAYDGIPVIWGNKNESKELIHQCWDEHIDFFHLDLPYIENWARTSSADAIKTFRLSINALHKNKVFQRPGDRLQWLTASVGVTLRDLRPKQQGIILICPPSETMADFFQIDIDQWLAKTINEIKTHTDLPYRVRFKPTQRAQRTTLVQDLIETKCMVTFNSNAGVEALFHGVPVISHECAPTGPVSLEFDELDNLPSLDLTSWGNSLAYSQWSMDELSNGLALRYTLEEKHLYKDPPKI